MQIKYLVQSSSNDNLYNYNLQFFRYLKILNIFFEITNLSWKHFKITNFLFNYKKQNFWEYTNLMDFLIISVHKCKENFCNFDFSEFTRLSDNKSWGTLHLVSCYSLLACFIYYSYTVMLYKNYLLPIYKMFKI